MTTLPMRNHQNAHRAVDGLIADFGFRRVLLAIATRLIRKPATDDADTIPDLAARPEWDGLSDHLRRDLGLLPNTNPMLHVDPILIMRRPQL